MPFRSEAQRRFLWMKHPDVARKFAADAPGQHDLPYHVSSPSSSKVPRMNALATARKSDAPATPKPATASRSGRAKARIKIKASKRGTFTAAATKAGRSVQGEAQAVLSNPNASPAMKKKANFARNAAKWNH